MMTKLVKKSVNVEKVLVKPRQSWMERLMVWGLSKPAVATIFITIMGYCGKAFAQETENIDAWSTVGMKVSDPSQNLRKIIFILLLFLMFMSVILALFKKISWFWLFSLLSWVAIFACIGMANDYLMFDETNVEDFFEACAWIIAFLTIALLPFMVTLIQYKIRKIDKKLLKHRLLIWLACGLIIFVIMGIFKLISILR